jgi:serine/threonine-protein kinase 24/25/MST4
VEALQELIERKQMWDANQNRKKHPVFYQETLHTISPKDENDEWVFDTVKSVAVLPRKRTARLRTPSAVFPVEDTLRQLDVKDGPLQPSTPGTVRKSTVRRQPSYVQQQQQQQQDSVRRVSMGPLKPAIAPKRPLQPDMSFGNSGSTMRLFRRVPSDSSTSGQLGTEPEVTTNENCPPLVMAPLVEPTNKEALVGRRLYNKAIEPTMAELHAQTAASHKREALANLSNAFAMLDSVDPEGAYHLLQNLVSAVSQDKRLNAAFLQQHQQQPATLSKTPLDGTPQGTVVIKTPAAAPVSPTKLVLSNANPHLRSHRRRQGTPDGSVFDRPPEKERDQEKSPLAAKYPGQEAPPGMEHCQHLSEVFYSRWANGLRHRWGAVTGA